ncbi:uncharacterized protein F58A4.6 isoform X2 [Cherax quadricarinatus]|uniref:uncharacterized protein F58A4.6 isoform X2 n=1 Tax=Cherax quadricarinatus TaxID=27406 RepID=UPI00387E8801
MIRFMLSVALINPTSTTTTTTRQQKADPKMASVVHVVVLAGNSYWDMLSVTQNTVIARNRKKSEWTLQDQHNEKDSNNPCMTVFCCRQSCFLDDNQELFGSHCISKGIRLNIRKLSKEIPQLKCHSEGLHFSVFLKELLNSDRYKFLVFQQWILTFKQKYSQAVVKKCKGHLLIWWTLKDSVPYIIDYEWCARMNLCAQERQHLDTVMSWLSTLGGACSALGDYSSHFAERAGAISLKQLDIAIRLGDPGIVSRCKLYAAISLIQKLKFKYKELSVFPLYLWTSAEPIASYSAWGMRGIRVD